MDEPEWKDFYDFDAEEAWVDAMESLSPIGEGTVNLKPYEDPF